MRVILAVAAAALVAGSTMAQPASPQGDRAGRQEEREQRFAEHRQQMAEDLKAILRIRPDQEAAWAAYTQARQTRPPMQQARPDPDAPTPARIAAMEQRMAARQEAMRARIKATLDLYNALSPEQQKAFDALNRMRGPGRMGPGSGMRPGFGRRGGDGPARP